MEEFQVNKYITLKLEDRKTYIYVGGENFRQCKSLVLNIDLEEIDTYDHIESIDEIVVENFRDESNITPYDEFRGHCSNLQAWAENNYDTRILHSGLAFPLLKKLVLLGDPQARKVFKEEIAAKFLSGYPPSLYVLFEGKYIRFLSKEEFLSIFSEVYPHLAQFRDNGEYIEVMFWIVHELKVLKLFNTPNSIVEEFILQVLADINSDYENWESWIFDLIESIKAKPLKVSILPTLFTTISQFSAYKQIEIYITLLNNIKNSPLITQFIDKLDSFFQKVIKKLYKIETIYDQAYLFADLLYSIDKTPLLTINYKKIAHFLDHLFNCFDPKMISANEAAFERMIIVINNIHDTTSRYYLSSQLRSRIEQMTNVRM